VGRCGKIERIAIAVQKDGRKRNKEGYITDEQGNRIGVLLGIEEYQKLLEESEELDAIRADDLTV
jgi:hypothetical protein